MVIVAAVDRSEQAKNVAREAKSLADAFDEPLHLVHVMSRSEFFDREMASVNEKGQPVDMDEIREVAAEHAKEAAEGIEGPYEAVGRVGKAADDIVKYANKHDARYIVTGGRRRSRTGKLIFGSVAQDILLNADRPVVTVLKPA